MATLTYVYGDQTAVLGPLATYAEPHAYDLCDEHSGRLSAPRGWEVLRLAPDPAALGPSSDDLLALADAVREAGRDAPAAPQSAGVAAGGGAAKMSRLASDPSRGGGRRTHLRVLPDAED